MKLSSHEEYGLRCLLQIAQEGSAGNLTIPQISEREGISEAYAAKLLRILRLGGFIHAARGPIGGYTLTRPPEQVVIGEVLSNIGGRLLDPDFCETHAGQLEVCIHETDCSIRPLWQAIQEAIDSVLNRITLRDLMAGEVAGGLPASADPLVQVHAASKPQAVELTK